MSLSRDPAKARAMQRRAAEKAQAKQREQGRKPLARSEMKRPVVRSAPKPKAPRPDARPTVELAFKRADWEREPLAPCARCQRASAHRHHCVLEQVVRGAGGEVHDPRNRLDLCHDCHMGHHGPDPLKQLPLTLLPSAVLIFAVDTLGAGPAYEHLCRRYSGSDPRMNVLLELAHA